MDSQIRSRTNKPNERYDKRLSTKAARQRQLKKSKKKFLATLKNET